MQLPRRDWAVTDPEGILVKLRRRRWRYIRAGHEDLIPHLAEILDTLRWPQRIRRSRAEASVDLYYRADFSRMVLPRGKRLLVVARIDRAARLGYVRTAYVVGEEEEAPVRWERPRE